MLLFNKWIIAIVIGLVINYFITPSKPLMNPIMSKIVMPLMIIIAIVIVINYITPYPEYFDSLEEGGAEESEELPEGSEDAIIEGIKGGGSSGGKGGSRGGSGRTASKSSRAPMKKGDKDKERPIVIEEEEIVINEVPESAPTAVKKTAKTVGSEKVKKPAGKTVPMTEGFGMDDGYGVEPNESQQGTTTVVGASLDYHMRMPSTLPAKCI
jgi:hypothetical protein